MAQTTRDASFGPVLAVTAHPNPPRVLVAFRWPSLAYVGPALASLACVGPALASLPFVGPRWFMFGPFFASPVVFRCYFICNT